MKWHDKILNKYKKEILSSAVFSIIFFISLLLWRFVGGKNFVWINIEPISAPSLFDRYVYSALTFISIGALLYWLKVYKYLYQLIVGVSGNWRVYKVIKRVIWVALILFMYFEVVPRTVDLLNLIASFFYNVIGFLLYAVPVFGLSLIVSIVVYIILNRQKHNHDKVLIESNLK